MELWEGGEWRGGRDVLNAEIVSSMLSNCEAAAEEGMVAVVYV